MHDIYRVCFDEDFVGDVLLAMTEKYKTIIELTSFATLQTAKSIINNSRSDWLSKANTLVWAEPCARWAELKMLSFWAGGISSFPLVPANTACYAGYAVNSYCSYYFRRINTSISLHYIYLFEN